MAKSTAPTRRASSSRHNAAMQPDVVRLRDVAKAAGISMATASLALNDKGRVADRTRRKVLRIAKQMNFEADPRGVHLVSGRAHNTIGLVAHELDLGTTTRKVLTLQRFLTMKGFKAPIHAYGWQMDELRIDQAELMRGLCRQRPLAIVCSVMGIGSEALGELRHYCEQGGVAVCYDFPVELPCARVVFDREDSAYQSVKYLLRLGHRQIAFATRAEGADIRKRGVERAFQEYGLTFHRHHWLPFKPYDVAGVELAQQLAKLKLRPSAICITDDATAAICIAELQRMGMRVPDDISVVGHDDQPIAAYSAVPITTVSQPIETITSLVLDLLLSRLDNPRPGVEQPVIVRGELIERASTAPPAAM